MTENLTIRPITGPDELSLFNSLPYVLNDELADDLATGRRRAAWMWVATRDERLVARIAWWGRESEPVPTLLDVFDLDGADPDRRAAGERLVAAAMAAVVPAGTEPPEYLCFVPPDWHDDPAAVEERMAILAGTGARPLVERLRFEWWLVGTLPSGEPVGFVCPARNDYGPIIGYIAVRPAHRGNGYVDDLVGEATRFLAAQDAPRIRAATDVGNAPMARAFERAGYANIEGVVSMVW